MIQLPDILYLNNQESHLIGFDQDFSINFLYKYNLNLEEFKIKLIETDLNNDMINDLSYYYSNIMECIGYEFEYYFVKNDIQILISINNLFNSFSKINLEHINFLKFGNYIIIECQYRKV